ncbi:shikimate transporter [Shigella sonnei]|nr:shikimate transporter [Shigella sonnei]
MMSLWDALRMNMMISYQELVRTFLRVITMALEAQSIFWIVFFSIMLANIAHDMVVCVQQPMFTEMFGASYRYSGAGVGYQVASVVGGGFTPFIAAALITYFAGNWHSVAIYLLAGCLISAMTALLMKDSQRA